MSNWIAALPVYNEEAFVDEVLTEVGKHADHVLVIDDGSTDGTSERLQPWTERDNGPFVRVVRHKENRGYGAALKSAFDFAIEHGYEYIVTLDCDGQHQPQRIPRFIKACEGADIVSGSRYLKRYEGDSVPPTQRLFINRQITGELNELLDLQLTDAFCGFKAYRVEALKSLQIKNDGYAMPLELWVQAAMRGMRIIEVPVPLIYLDLNRSFGGTLDDSEKRLSYYRDVICKSLRAMKAHGFHLPERKQPSQLCK